MLISGYTRFLLLLAIPGSLQRSNPSSLTYRGAVVELGSLYYENDSSKTLTDNAKKYVRIIEEAAAKDVDIVVFPELGLPSLNIPGKPQVVSRSTVIPSPSENFTPCTNFSIPVHDAVRMIACAAERNSIYVVVNLFEKELCSGKDCASDGIFVYITNVAFDRNGTIISRSRKFHLVDDFGVMRVMETTELSTIDTDFGVTFANVVCFDLFFEMPALTLIREFNITDIIVSTGFFTVMPFLSSVQLEAGWSYATDVNLLASGHNRVETGHSGSGIYAGREGVLTAVLPLNDHEELLIADIRKKNKISVLTPPIQHIDEHYLKSQDTGFEHYMHDGPQNGRDSQKFYWMREGLDEFETEIIAGDGVVVKKLNHTELECIFHMNITNLNPSATYRLFAHNGLHYVGNLVSLGTRVCAIVQCANETIDSCGHVENSATTFSSITITAIYVDNMRTIMIPTTLGSDMLPLKNWSSNRYKLNEQVITTLSLPTPTRNLVTFGFWGRNFEKDESKLQNF